MVPKPDGRRGGAQVLRWAKSGFVGPTQKDSAFSPVVSVMAGVETTRSPTPPACMSQGLDHTFRLAQFCSPHKIHPCRSGRHCPAHCLAAGTFSNLFSSIGNTKNSHYPIVFFPCVKENGSLLQVGHRLFRYRDLNLARPAFLKGVMINTAA